MSTTWTDIDDALSERATELLGTTTPEETVNTALRKVVEWSRAVAHREEDGSGAEG
jgi:Arc/MetJ family transcription regulator